MFAAINSSVPVQDLLLRRDRPERQRCLHRSWPKRWPATRGLCRQNDRARAHASDSRSRHSAIRTACPTPANMMSTRELGILARHIIRTYPEFYKIFGEREFTWNKIQPVQPQSAAADDGTAPTAFQDRHDARRAATAMVGFALRNIHAADRGRQRHGRPPRIARDRSQEASGMGLHVVSRRRILLAEGQTIGSAKIYGGAEGSVPLVAGREVRVMMPKSGGDRLIARIVYTGPVRRRRFSRARRSVCSRSGAMKTSFCKCRCRRPSLWSAVRCRSARSMPSPSW